MLFRSRDVRSFLNEGLVRVEELRAKFDEIEPLLKRYPAIDPATFRSAVVEFCDEAEGGSGQ